MPLALVTGTGLAIEPSRTATLGLLRARAAAGRARSSTPTGARSCGRRPRSTRSSPASRPTAAAIIVGGDGELEAAGLGPESAEVVVIKHGPNGVTVHERGVATHIPPMPVEVVNGLGAGDAFLAAFSAALLDGLPIRSRPRAAAAAPARSSPPASPARTRCPRVPSSKPS